MKTNYHTHSTYCDGKNTLREMVLTAIEKHFDILGFSGHSMYPFASDWHIAVNDHKTYCDEVLALKEEFKDKIEIQLGFEADYIPGVASPTYSNYEKFKPDFIIGSVHYVPGKKGFFEADASPTEVLQGIRKYFNGNEKRAVQEYFALEREMLDKAAFSILGHADLITKQNNKRTLFDSSAVWYKKELASTAKAIAKSGVCVEVNTGGMARSGMLNPYPEPYFLSLLHEYNIPITLSSDCHNKDQLDFWFTEAVEYVKKAGYTELSYLQSGNLKQYKI